MNHNDEHLAQSIDQLENGEAVAVEFGKDGNLHPVADDESCDDGLNTDCSPWLKVPDNDCCSTDEKCAEGSAATSGVLHSIRDDILMLTEVLSCPHVTSGVRSIAGEKLEILIARAFPEEQPLPPKDRVFRELAELAKKIRKLGDFIARGKPDFIDADHWDLMEDQLICMKKYHAILVKRLKKF